MSPNQNEFTATSQKVATSIGEIAVHQRGRGAQTLVLWPSIFTDHRIYDGIVSRLSDRFRFILIDGPGHGASIGDDRSYTGQDFARGMIDVMDALDIERATVGGTSWGGITGAELAVAAPERVEAVVLMNTPMTLDKRSPGLKARMISAGSRWMLWSNLFRDGVARSFFSAATLERHVEYMTAFHAMLKAASPKELSAAVRSVMLQGEPLMPRLSTITAPTLILAGKQDEMYPLSVQEEAARRLPNGHFETVDSKHISVVDTPDAVAGALLAFMDKAVSP
ncbi:MAG: alpha/beta hydrolase [Pseudomonadota bacterium]